jgi:cyclopropane fatty-acyl-phospholipid synthase-like methyltransferase
MTSPEIPPLHQYTDFNSPLSSERAERLIQSLGPLTGARVVDLGCGWGEFLLRVLSSDATTHGHGIDLREDLVARARELADARGLSGRASFEAGDAGAWHGDDVGVVINIGSSHAWGGDPVTHTDNALAGIRRLLKPGGRAVFGEGIWERPPTAEQLATTAIPAQQYGSAADLVDKALAHGFELRGLSQASLDEWDWFESRHGLGHVDWLAAHPDSPDAEEVRKDAASHRQWWLRGSRATLGFVYLTLVVVA